MSHGVRPRRAPPARLHHHPAATSTFPVTATLFTCVEHTVVVSLMFAISSSGSRSPRVRGDRSP
jgi:hypothetical protein